MADEARLHDQIETEERTARPRRRWARSTAWQRMSTQRQAHWTSLPVALAQALNDGADNPQSGARCWQR